jgi:hypothetical protein
LKKVKPEFSGTLDELVDVTKQHMNNSLQVLWAITQQQSVVPKIKASIESVHQEIVRKLFDLFTFSSGKATKSKSRD